MKNILLRRTPRERVLILFFLFAAALVWLVSAGSRMEEKWRAARVTAADLAAQKLWFDRRSAIEERARAAAESLDPAHTLDATRLAGEVSAIAGRLGLTIAVEPPRTERTGELAYHTVQVSFRRADLAALVRYYRELERRAPYLALEKSLLRAGSANPAEIDAVFSIFSVEAAD
jgi:hypothetical protein